MAGRKQKFCLGVYNCDTESTVEGYMSSFLAKRLESRLLFNYPNNSYGKRKKDLYIKKCGKIDSLRSKPCEFVKTTSQEEVKQFFDSLQESSKQCKEIILSANKNLKPENVDVFYVILFANISWDLDVLKGIIFDGSYEYDSVGEESNIAEFRYGYLHFRDFLKLTGYRSIKMAGQVCTKYHKTEGEDVYQLKFSDIPKNWEDYSEKQKEYMINDIMVMEESLNIILNRKENTTILYMSELPLTATGFGRWRMLNNSEVVCFDDESHIPQNELNMFRWQYARPYLAYLMRAYKGGYCGPNPNKQYKCLKNVVCFDAVSMYPDKMLFHKMMQCSKFTTMNFNESDSYYNNEKAVKLIYDVENFVEQGFDENGLWKFKPDDDEFGLIPWIGTLKLRIHGMKKNNGKYMMPIISSFKLEDKGINVRTVNGKVISADECRIILSSVDLMLVLLAYDVEILNLEKWLNLCWKTMLFVQKRDLWEAYKRKMEISKVIKSGIENSREYWENKAGFNYNSLLELSESEYLDFAKNYKMICKADANGKYGLTVESPIHPKTVVIKNIEEIPEWVSEDKRNLAISKINNGIPVFISESKTEMASRLVNNSEEAPKRVKTNDYCAGSSITMWARWQLIVMMYFFFKNDIETIYCDTDSLFVEDSEKARECIEQFNEKKKKEYYESYIASEEIINVDDAEGLGQFEEDKKCKYFRTLGSKCYAYISEKDKVKITVAGLRAKDFTGFMQKEIDSGIPSFYVLMNRFRPNTVLAPNAVHKLLKNTENMGFDENGLWRGAVLEEVGFSLINMLSKFHLNNAKQCALIQSKKDELYYIKLFNDNRFIDETGFDKEFYNCLIEDFSTLEDQQPIKGGLV